MQSQPKQPPRLLGLDPGARRTGVAVSDALGLYAHPRPALVSRSQRELVEAIARLVDEEHADEVVVGLPLALSGKDSAQTRAVRDLVDHLRDRLAVPVTTWDERLTSVEAGRALRGRGKRAGAVDSVAAALVLQAVLDARRGKIA